MAAKEEDLNGLLNVSKCYRLGKGTAIDLDEAEKWCLKAIELGHKDGDKELEKIKEARGKVNKKKGLFSKFKK